MKRSDILKIMQNALWVWNGTYYDESLESYLLSELEEAGMLPPDSLPNSLQIGESASIEADRVMRRWKWEAEDE